MVVARGKSAVRGLKLIASLENRVEEFGSSNTEEIRDHPEVVFRNYEEIVGICNILEEEAVNSIENWTDTHKAPHHCRHPAASVHTPS